MSNYGDTIFIISYDFDNSFTYLQTLGGISDDERFESEFVKKSLEFRLQ